MTQARRPGAGRTAAAPRHRELAGAWRALLLAASLAALALSVFQLFNLGSRGLLLWYGIRPRHGLLLHSPRLLKLLGGSQ